MVRPRLIDYVFGNIFFLISMAIAFMMALEVSSAKEKGELDKLVPHLALYAGALFVLFWMCIHFFHTQGELELQSEVQERLSYIAHRKYE